MDPKEAVMRMVVGEGERNASGGCGQMEKRRGKAREMVKRDDGRQDGGKDERDER